MRTARRLTIPIIVTLAVTGGCMKSDRGREYPVYRLSQSPVIDGDLDGDRAWQTIPAEDAFVTPLVERLGTHLPAYKQTYFKVGYDDESLYFGVESREPWTKYLNRNVPLDTLFEKDDGIELFLSVGSDHALHHFIINANGSRWSGAGDQATALNDWEARTIVGEYDYTVEVRIPFAKLERIPGKDEVWTANVVRNTITIVSPEDRQTSWSPVRDVFDEPSEFGRFVFKRETLSRDQARDIEQGLAADSDKFLQLEKQALIDEQDKEDVLAESYRRTVENVGHGLTGITSGAADLVTPPGQPADEVWRYGLGFPMQIAPRTAALLTNIRMEGSGNIDFEIGTDVILFDDLGDITAEGAIAASRFERYVDPEHGPVIVRKGPILGGFVPLGAVLDDGSPHPAAGTGFGMCWSISHELDENGKFEYTSYFDRRAILYQFAYDGEHFEIRDEQPIDASKLLPDWNLVGNFVTNAIPDREDLLYVMVARVQGVSVAGFTRWHYDADGWRPVSFTPVTGLDETWSEPSLIREADGSLLFSARSYDRAEPVNAFDIAVWRSTDDGTTWDQVIYEKNRRARSPVSINRTVDGTPFIAANTPPMRRTREVLSIWPLDESRTKLEGRITARDARAEFGPAPSGSWWRIDHPTSAVLRLKDGKWHCVLVYRIVDNGEIEGDAPPAPQTGTYVEEVFSAGEPVPPWKFE